MKIDLTKTLEMSGGKVTNKPLQILVKLAEYADSNGTIIMTTEQLKYFSTEVCKAYTTFQSHLADLKKYKLITGRHKIYQINSDIIYYKSYDTNEVVNIVREAIGNSK